MREEMKKKKLGRFIWIVRTEQWEYTATCGDYSATGDSEQGAELQLLREITGLSVNLYIEYGGINKMVEK